MIEGLQHTVAFQDFCQKTMAQKCLAISERGCQIYRPGDAQLDRPSAGQSMKRSSCSSQDLAAFEIQQSLVCKKSQLPPTLQIIINKALVCIWARPLLLKATSHCSSQAMAYVDEWLPFAPVEANLLSTISASACLEREQGSDAVPAGKPPLLLHHLSKPGLPPSDCVTR